MPPILGGLTLMTLGMGLLIDLPENKQWAKIIIYQFITALGTGPIFQAPLVALQALNAPGDIATVTSTFATVRNFASPLGVVFGQVVFQNRMAKQAGRLAAAVGPDLAMQLGGGNAGASTMVVDALAPEQRMIVRQSYNDSFKYVWIMYCLFTAVGLASAFFIQQQDLKTEHVETETGLDAQEKNRLEAQARVAEKR
jgi:fucose permease